MYVKRVCYPIRVLGPGQRLGIWLAGCNKRCLGCMSPELQTTKGSKNIPVKEMEKMFRAIGGQIDGVTISGGEPFLQAKELYKLVDYIKRNITDDIIVFSGYKIEELKQMQSTYVDKPLALIPALMDANMSMNKMTELGYEVRATKEYIFFITAMTTRSCQSERENCKHFAITDKYL